MTERRPFEKPSEQPDLTGHPQPMDPAKREKLEREHDSALVSGIEELRTRGRLRDREANSMIEEVRRRKP